MQKTKRQSATLNSFGPGTQTLFHTVLGLFALLSGTKHKKHLPK